VKPVLSTSLLLALLFLLGACIWLARRRGRELRFLYALVAPLWGHRVLLTTMLRISRTRGGIAPVVVLRLWPLAPRPVVLLNDMTLARDVLSRGDVFHTMARENPAIVSLLGARGLFTTHSTAASEWQRLRRVTDPMLSSDALFGGAMFADLLATARAYVANWGARARTDAPGSLLREVARVLIPAQSIAFFGDLFPTEVNRRAGDDLLDNFRGIGEGLFFPPTAWLRRPWTRGHLARSWEYIDGIVAVIVADARRPDAARGAYPQGGEGADARPALFRLLSDAHRAGSIDEGEVRDAVALFLNAGAPLHLVFWVLHTLAHRPDVEAQVVDELRAALARGPLAFPRLRELGELRRVVLEVMRLVPPVPLFQPRRATDAARLGAVDVPAGTQILISPYVVHRDPALGEDVESFRPDRPGNNVLAPHMFPFSVGARTCQGRNFSMLAVSAVLIAVLERHAVHVHAHACPAPSEAIYCRPSHDLPFSVTPRPPQRPAAEALQA